jgi:hypothetical protein
MFESGIIPRSEHAIPEFAFDGTADLLLHVYRYGCGIGCIQCFE